MKKIFYTAFYFCSALLLSSCIGDLDQYPHEDETAASIYTSAEEQGLPYDVLAHHLGLDEGAFRRLLEGRIPVTEALARGLADTLGSTPDFWMRLEFNYQSDLRRLGLKRPGA